jgi:hypothetical protein
VIFHSKVVNDKNEANGACGVSKKTGGRRFEKIEGRQKSDKATVTELPSFLQAVHGAVDPEEDVAFSGFVDLDVGKQRETRQDVRRVRVDIDTDVLRGEKRSAEVKVGEVERRAEVSILRDNSVKGAFKGNEGSDVGRGWARGGKTVTTRSFAHASIDVVFERTKVTWGKER